MALILSFASEAFSIGYAFGVFRHFIDAKLSLQGSAEKEKYSVKTL
jgi:hypothetical protein